MKEKFPDSINDEDVERELARIAKEMEKDLNEVPEDLDEAV